MLYGIGSAAGNGAAAFYVLAHGVAGLATANLAALPSTVGFFKDDLLAIAFIVLTSLLSSHAIARAAHRRDSTRG